MGSSRQHVVIIGAGFGGTRVLRGLRDVDVRITLIDRNNFHTFQPLLYQVATAGLEVGDITFPVRTLLRRHRDAHFIMADVKSADLDARTVRLDHGESVTYDFLVVAAGSITSSFGVPGVDLHTLPLKTVDDAINLRDHIISTLEIASRQPAPTSPAELGIVVVGGGPTGVETAGGLRELIDHVLTKDYPELALDALPITLVEAGPQLLGAFDNRLGEQAADALRRRGITVETDVGVDHIEARAVHLSDGRRLHAATVVWAAGVTASPLALQLDTERERGNRIRVLDDLSLPGHPEVFAIGDIASARGGTDAALPQVAQPAIQGGHHVAAQIRRTLAGESRTTFTYKDKGSMATIGRNQAVVEFPNGRTFHGLIGWTLWLGLHIVYLMGFRNRISTMVSWAWNYLTYDRSGRVLAQSRLRPPEM